VCVCVFGNALPLCLFDRTHLSYGLRMVILLLPTGQSTCVWGGGGYKRTYPHDDSNCFKTTHKTSPVSCSLADSSNFKIAADFSTIIGGFKALGFITI
jgi:hypothetical protein